MISKNQKIVILIGVSVVFITAVFFVIWQVISILPHCKMNSNLICQDQIIGNDGFRITFGNQNDARIYIQDISISQKGAEKCNYLKPEIVDTDKDYYISIRAKEATTFFVTRDHPDGECLMRGMVPGKKYSFDVEIVYFLNGEKKLALGSGVAEYVNKDLDVIT